MQQQDDRSAAVERMWSADRVERARLWNEAMARGVAQFWIDARRPDLANPGALAALDGDV